MIRPLRIVVTADPYIPVPPVHYGGIERVIDLLVRGLRARGHSVTLVAHPGSTVPCDRLVGYGRPPHFTRRARAAELIAAGSALLSLARRTDVVHSFGRLAALAPILPLRGLAKVQTWQRGGVPWRSVRIAGALAGRSLLFTGCSTSVWAGGGAAAGRWVTVFNGVDTGRFPATGAVAPDAPLVFLGRLEPEKGAHHAVAIARGAGRDLVLAGNRVEEGTAAGYFEREIAPHVDDRRVRYVGPVDDGEKARLLGSAAALLMPVAWEEPFGIVMAEAMACGTPVVAFRRGSVPEVVRDGVGGFTCTDVAGAVACVARLGELPRAAVRRECEERFSADAVVSGYLAAYARAAGRGPAGDPPGGGGR